MMRLFAQTCEPGGDFLGFPTWYKYLDGQQTTNNVLGPGTTICTPVIGHANDVWLILAAVIEMLLRIAILLAIGLIIYGGISYISSQGEPDKTAAAQHTITNALIGLVISVGATTIISFVAGRFN